MQELDFELDGVWASTVGITLQKPVTFSKAVLRRQTFVIAGRNGDLHSKSEVYNNRQGAAVCYALNGTNVSHVMPNIMSFLFTSNNDGYRKLRTSYDLTHFWEVTVANGGELAPRLNLLNPFTIEFDCKPFQIVEGSEILQANGTFTNPTGFKSYPLIKVVSASANDTISCNGATITFTDSVSNIYIDNEDCRAYSGNTNYDSKISCSSFIEFGTGTNSITCEGTTIQVAPRWRTL